VETINSSSDAAVKLLQEQSKTLSSLRSAVARTNDRAIEKQGNIAPKEPSEAFQQFVAANEIGSSSQTVARPHQYTSADLGIEPFGQQISGPRNWAMGPEKTVRWEETVKQPAPQVNLMTS
jgi:hypothetical protein